jgi:xylan 1,4-beta-xylosidase
VNKISFSLFLFIALLSPAQMLAAPPTQPTTSRANSAFDGTPPPPFTSSAETYSGISGPGSPITGDGSGGYTSGQNGVQYSGPNPKPGWKINPKIATGSAIKDGLLPNLRPIWELHLRDTIICLGGDGNYYMTGSSGDNIWDRNDGIELWRSTDLQKWDYLGSVWSIEKDGTWQKQWRYVHEHPARDVWAPEIHYIKNNYYFSMCMAGGAGSGILVSTTGKPEGPYKSPLVPDTRLVGGIDATLFQDDDGKVYFTNRGAQMIYLMKDDMTGFDGPGHLIQFDLPKDGSGTKASIAEEGASLFKRNGKYYLGGAVHLTDKRRYSSAVAIADNIFGPYHQWHEAVPCGGGGNYFQDKSGNWFCTLFGNDSASTWREKPGIVQIDFSPDGKIIIAKNQPDFLLQKTN